MFKKWDIIIIIVLLVISFIPEIIFGFGMKKNYNRTYAEITVAGKVYKKIPLSEHRGEDIIDIKTKFGYNKVIVKDQSISISESDCPDKVCMAPGYISKRGDSLVCLPHRLMIEIKGDQNEDDDIINAY